MNNKKYTYRAAVLSVCAIFTFSGLAGCTKSSAQSAVSEAESISETSSASETVTDTGTSAAASVSDAQTLLSADASSLIDRSNGKNSDTVTEITLADGATVANGGGVNISGNVITVNSAGKYNITGSLSDGQIIVDAEKCNVELSLGGVNIACSYAPAIYVYKSANTTVSLSPSSINTLSDGSAYTFADSYSSEADAEPNAALYSKSDLLISGGGTLEITANYNNGITSKDTLEINNATVSVQAKNNGINGKDCNIITGSSISVTCSGDAIRSTNDTDTTLGYVKISDSQITVNSAQDGIDAATYLAVSGGSLDFTCGGGSSKTLTGDVSSKGLKALSGIALAAGNAVINSCDDTIHTNAALSILSGSYQLSSSDDGLHADTSIDVSGGEINITKSYEGIESSNITLANADISVTASDDGINVCGGNDQSAMGGRPGQNSFDADSGGSFTFNSGTLKVNAGGDGLDSNGSIIINGGEIYVDGPADNGNGALDYNSSCTMNGGILVAVGSSGMAQAPSAGSQNSLLYNLSSSQPAGTTVTLSDAGGNTLVSHASQKTFNSVVISAPGLETGESYTLSVGSYSTEVTLTGITTTLGSSGGMGGNSGSMGGNRGGFMQ